MNNSNNETWFDQFEDFEYTPSVNNNDVAMNENEISKNNNSNVSQQSNEDWFNQFEDFHQDTSQQTSNIQTKAPTISNSQTNSVTNISQDVQDTELKPFELNAKRTDLWQSTKNGIGNFTNEYMNYMADRPTNNILANGAKDVGEIVGGMAQLVGAGVNNIIYKPIRRALDPNQTVVTENGRNFARSLKSDLSNIGKVVKRSPDGKNAYRLQLRENHPELFGFKDATIQGVKEQYGQTGDLSKGEFDPEGFAQSYLKHPVLNTLDLIGLGEVGKIKTVSKATRTMRANRLAKKELVDEALFSREVEKAIKEVKDLKGGQRVTPDEAKEIMRNIRKDKVIAKKGKEYKLNDQGKLVELPKSSDNLVIGAVDDLLKTNVARKVINTLSDNKAGEAIGDFLGSKSNSSLLGAKNTSKRQLKELQKKQKDDLRQDIYDSQRENNELFGNLSEEEGAKLFRSAERGVGYDKVIPEGGYKNKPSGTNVVTDGQKAIEEFLTEKPSVKSADELELEKINNEINNSRTKIVPNSLIKRKNELEQRLAKTQNGNNFDAQKYNDKIKKHEQDSKTDVGRIGVPLRDKLKEKIGVNSDYFRSKNMLTEETQNRTVLETYLAHKYSLHTVNDVRKFCSKNPAVKEEAIKEIMNLPDKEKPFYVPRMYKERLTSADFKIFGNNNYLDDIDNLRKRSYTGNTDVIENGKYHRSFNVEDVVNKLDEQRIKLKNMESFIDDVTKNFAKPLSEGMKLEKGYVAFNPQAIKDVFFGKIDLSDLMIDGLKNNENIEVALKNALQKGGNELIDDIKGAVDSLKNNKDSMMQIPEYIYKDLTKSVSNSGKKPASTIFNIGTDAFKKNVLGLNAKWVINNRIGNTIMAALKGTNLLNPANIRRISKLSDDLFPSELVGETFHSAERTPKMKKTGIKQLDAVLSLADGESVIDNKLLSMFSVPGKVVNKVSNAVFNFNQKFETMDRKTVYLNELKKEQKQKVKDFGTKMASDVELLKQAKNDRALKEKILARVDDILGDYSTMTPFERDVMKKFMPFYSWYRTISRHTLTLPKTNPIRTSIVAKLSALVDDENNERPFFQKHAVKTEGNAELDRSNLLLNYEHSIPYSTFQESADNPISAFHPLINNAVDAISGVNTYNGMPLQSKGFEKVYGGGTTDLNDKEAHVINLPASEKYKAFLINSLRDMIPGFKQSERVIGGSVANSIKAGKPVVQPFDKLWDTDFGGYMEEEVRPKKKGWTNKEQLLRYVLPLQKEYEITKNPYGYRRKQRKKHSK